MSNIDVLGIGNKGDFPEVDNQKFKNLDSYIKMAHKMITSYAPSIRVGLAQEMLANEDAIANIAHTLMIADWKYDNRGSLFGYRKQMVLWAIKSYVGRSNKTNKQKILSIDKKLLANVGGTTTFSDLLADESHGPIKNVENDERLKIIKDKINYILTCGILSEQQAEYIRLFFLEEISAAQIARDHNVSRQSVHDMISRALKEVRIYAEKDPKLMEYVNDY